MILVDSLYINNSGGVRLLEYLVCTLNRRNIDFFLLADSRCMGRFDYCKRIQYMKASLMGRKKFYQKNASSFSSVLCFGNIPSPIRMNVPVYTYFHNINLLTLSEAHGYTDMTIMWLKRAVFRYYKKNTDYWIVQTENTACELCKNLQEKENRIKIFPFYELPAELCLQKEKSHGDDYVYISNYTGAKGHEELLDAWEILHNRGIIRMLHLTVPSSATAFCEKVQKAQNRGVKVMNHGFVPFEEVLKLYKQSKAIIYPSHNESLGLGIVEAITAGCDVIGSDLPFIHTICKPSAVFDPSSPESIVNAVCEYEKGGMPQSELLIYNQVDELIDLLIRA